MTAAELVTTLARRGWTIGTAESLTGGLVCAALTQVPGASAVVRGGVVAYSSEIKASVLGVDADLLRVRGAVDHDVAAQLAVGARRVLGCQVGVATTGVAGPDTADGMPVGTVFVGVATPQGIAVERLALTGDRDQIRAKTVAAALALVARRLENLRDADGGAGYR